MPTENDTIQKLRDRYLTQLGSPDINERRDAFAILAEIGSSTVVELANHISESDDKARALCARALGATGNKDAVRPLMTLIGDPHWLVRASAVRGLSRVGSSQDLERMRKSLAFERHPVVLDAVASSQRVAEDGEL